MLVTELAVKPSASGVALAVVDQAPAPVALAAATRTVYSVPLVNEPSVVDVLVTVLWRQLDGGIFDLYEIVPAFLVGSLAILALGRRGAPGEAVFKRLAAADRGARGSARTPRRASPA